VSNVVLCQHYTAYAFKSMSEHPTGDAHFALRSQPLSLRSRQVCIKVSKADKTLKKSLLHIRTRGIVWIF